MITERDKSLCSNTKEIINKSNLDITLKADLIDVLDENLANLNGRTLEERVQGLAKSQFAQSRMLINILAGNYNKPRTWKDVIVECKWCFVILGTIITICSIFNPQICQIIEKVLN